MRTIDRLLFATALAAAASPAAGQRAHANVSVTVIAAADALQLEDPVAVAAHDGSTDYESRFGISADRPYAVAVRVSESRAGVTVLLDDAERGLEELGSTPVVLDSTAAAVSAESIRCRLSRAEGAASEPVVLSISVTHF